MSSSTIMPLNEIYEEFDFLGDWEDRCDFLIDLGFELPKLPDAAKIEENRVKGCQSNVWMVTSLKGQESPAIMDIQANSDAIIVNGLIAVLLAAYDRKTPQQILDTDIESIFKKLELDQHLSSQRRNGLAGMVQRIREDAIQYLVQ